MLSLSYSILQPPMYSKRPFERAINNGGTAAETRNQQGPICFFLLLENFRGLWKSQKASSAVFALSLFCLFTRWSISSFSLDFSSLSSHSVNMWPLHCHWRDVHLHVCWLGLTLGTLVADVGLFRSWWHEFSGLSVSLLLLLHQQAIFSLAIF